MEEEPLQRNTKEKMKMKMKMMMDFPLLQNIDDNDDDERNNEDEEALKDNPQMKEFKQGWPMFLRESKKIWRVAGPITLNGFFSYALNSSVQIFAGHLSAVELSAVSTSFLVTTNFPTIVLVSHTLLSIPFFSIKFISLFDLIMQYIQNAYIRSLFL